MKNRVKIGICLLMALSLLCMVSCELPWKSGTAPAESIANGSETSSDFNEPTETVTEEWVTENPDMHLGNDENFTWESFVPFS